MHILEIPECMLMQILECLSYDEVARKRLVCRTFDKIGQNVLNRGFTKMVKKHSNYLKKIKQQLPRRESERRNHPLSRHADILTCIETRISMLSMTYTKYIDLNLCCFIPGKVIDEALGILLVVESSTTKQLRSHEVLQELRDISSMAIDHFDEKIAPCLKKSFCDLSSQKYGSIYQMMQSPLPSSILIQPDSNRTQPVNMNYKNRVKVAMQPHDSINTRVNMLSKAYKGVLNKLYRVINSQAKYTNQFRQYSVQISEINSQVADLRRRLQESESKNRELTANINQFATIDVEESEDNSNSGDTSGTSKTDDNVTTTTKTLRNILPRSATILLKRKIVETKTTTTTTTTDGNGEVKKIKK